VTQVELVSCLNKAQSFVSKVEILEKCIDEIQLIDWLSVLETHIGNFIFKSLHFFLLNTILLGC
jgi:hypothetical protein